MMSVSRASLRQAAKGYGKGEHVKAEEKHGDKAHEHAAEKHEHPKSDANPDHTKSNGRTEPSNKLGGKLDGSMVTGLQARAQQGEAKAVEAKAKLKKNEGSYDHANDKLHAKEHTIQSLSEMLEKLHEENEKTLKEREGMQEKLQSAEEEVQQLRDSLKVKEKEANALAMSNNKTGSSL
eukprot:5692234-Pyramimonas_sp.AAC.1